MASRSPPILASCLAIPGITRMCHCAQLFYVDSWELNSGPNTHKASAVLEPSSQLETWEFGVLNLLQPYLGWAQPEPLHVSINHTVGNIQNGWLSSRMVTLCFCEQPVRLYAECSPVLQTQTHAPPCSTLALGWKQLSTLVSCSRLEGSRTGDSGHFFPVHLT